MEVREGVRGLVVMREQGGGEGVSSGGETDIKGTANKKYFKSFSSNRNKYTRQCNRINFTCTTHSTQCYIGILLVPVTEGGES